MLTIKDIAITIINNKRQNKEILAKISSLSILSVNPDNIKKNKNQNELIITKVKRILNINSLVANSTIIFSKLRN